VKVVLVTQRVDIMLARGERRDALDQRLAAWLAVAGATPVPVPNDPEIALAIYCSIPVAGLVLSGGNDLFALGGDAPERDATEHALAQRTRQDGKPVLGICRGFQLLVHEAGGSLAHIEGHVAARHALSGDGPAEVNSFHSWAVTALPAGWQARAIAPDGTIEMAATDGGRTLGIMWHPEREIAFRDFDLRLARRLLALGDDQ
jgi:gamma-glutamyl-gamma-aminobutyrate hydrolase PuuD